MLASGLGPNVRNKSGIEIKKGNWIRYINARGDETEAYIRSVDRNGPMAKTRGAWLHLSNGDSCNADFVIETLGPMTVSKGGVVKQNPVKPLQWRVGYSYVNPDRAGPFKGRTVLDYKPEKGDEIFAVMGRAVVTSVSKVPTPKTTLENPNARRKATAKAPKGFYANPVVRGESNADAVRYAELFGGASGTIKAWSDHYIVRFRKGNEKNWSLQSVFKTKKDAEQYAHAFARANPTYTVSVIFKA